MLFQLKYLTCIPHELHITEYVHAVGRTLANTYTTRILLWRFVV